MTEPENSPQTSSDLVRTWFERVWNQNDESFVHELLSEDCIFEGIAVPARGPGGFLPFLRAFQGAFDDIHIEVVELVENDDFVMGHNLFTATHKRTGNQVETEFSFSAEFENGKLQRSKNVVDFTKMLSQVGVISERAVDQVFE